MSKSKPSFNFPLAFISFSPRFRPYFLPLNLEIGSNLPELRLNENLIRDFRIQLTDLISIFSLLKVIIPMILELMFKEQQFLSILKISFH